MKIRAHHLICIQNYKGKGYSQNFCEKMNEMQKKMRNPVEEWQIIDGADEICAQCPNLANETCTLGNDEVRTRDQNYANLLELSLPSTLKTREILNLLRSKLNENAFSKLCETCSWYKNDTCSWESLKNRFLSTEET